MAKRVTIQLVKQLICMLMVAVVLAPIILVLFASFKTKADMVKISPLLLPPQSRFTLENFQKVLSNKYMLIGFKNTGIILVVSIFFNVMFGTITAFIIERFQFRFKGAIVVLFFIGMLIPSFVTEIARFKVINSLNLYNTLGAPIIIYVASDLMQLYIYRQFISTLPLLRTVYQDHFPSAGASHRYRGDHQGHQHHQRHVHSLPVHAQEQAAYPDHLPDGLCQCPARFLAESGGGHHHSHAANHLDLLIFPEIHPGRDCGRGC